MTYLTNWCMKCGKPLNGETATIGICNCAPENNPYHEDCTKLQLTQKNTTMKIIVKTKKGTYKAKVTPGTNFDFPMQGESRNAGKIHITTAIRTEYEVNHDWTNLSGSISSPQPKKDVLDIWVRIKYHEDDTASNIYMKSIDLCTECVTLKDKNKVL
jgi:hypothetical protein